jgi:hypothetical protein
VVTVLGGISAFGITIARKGTSSCLPDHFLLIVGTCWNLRAIDGNWSQIRGIQIQHPNFKQKMEYQKHFNILQRLTSDANSLSALCVEWHPPGCP